MECVSNEMFGKKMVSSSREGESKKRGVESWNDNENIVLKLNSHPTDCPPPIFLFSSLFPSFLPLDLRTLKLSAFLHYSGSELCINNCLVLGVSIAKLVAQHSNLDMIFCICLHSPWFILA
jgi:hypothetical protein